MDNFKLLSEYKPLNGKYIYLVDNGKLKIVHTGITGNPKNYITFCCFDCSFFDEFINTESLSCTWKEVGHQYVRPCEVCKEDKFYHFCGKTTHPYCEQYIKEHERKKEEQEKKNEKYREIEYYDNRTKNFFSYYYHKSIRFIIFLFVLGSLALGGDFFYRYFFAHKIIYSGITVVSDEVQNIIGAFKK